MAREISQAGFAIFHTQSGTESTDHSFSAILQGYLEAETWMGRDPGSPFESVIIPRLRPPTLANKAPKHSLAPCLMPPTPQKTPSTQPVHGKW